MRIVICTAALAALGLAAPVSAGVFADDLSRCFVERASDDDRAMLVRWMFSAMSQDPRLGDLNRLDRAGRDRINKDMAQVVNRLLLKDCRKETGAAVRNEGADSIKTAFGALGHAAANSMFSSPAATAELEGFASHIDEAGMARLMAENGITPAGQ